MTHYIQSALAPLRTQPDPSAECVDEALHGMSVQLIPKMYQLDCVDNAWHYVETDYRYRGWVQSAHLCAISTTAKARNTPPTHYVNVPTADVLVAPKVQSPSVCMLTRGALVWAYETKNGYQRVGLADGQSGYIRAAFCVALSPVDKATVHEAAVQTALTYLGTQYRWGGKSPLGIDCSGLCFMAYWLHGVTLFRDARIEAGFAAKAVAGLSMAEDAQRGDLLYFPGHIGMYLGDGDMVHSSEAGNGVRVERVPWERCTAVGRV